MAFDDGYKAVTTAGTRLQLTTTSTPCSWVRVTAVTSNLSQVNVGDISVVAATGATERGEPLYPGATTTLAVNDVSKVYIDSRISGEAVTYSYGAGSPPPAPASTRTGVDRGGLENSVGTTTSTAAPSAAAQAVVQNVTAGATYKIRVVLALTGTAETQLVNCSIRNSASTICLIPTLSGQVVTIDVPRWTAVGATLNVLVIANATAGSIYTASLIATRIE